MTSLNWQEHPQKNPPRSSNGSSGVNSWFGIAMGLLGLIVGIGIMMVVKGV
jgi:hypothetical protein